MANVRIAQERDLLANVDTRLPQARRVLVLAPHPDDEVFGCGGLLALLKVSGAAITVHILTDGAQGGDNADGSLVATRQSESCAALEVLGLSGPVFWDLPDRGLSYGEPLIERIAGVIRAAEADLVLLPSPTELHPDHQVVAFAGFEALRRLGEPRHAAFFEVGVPLAVPTLVIDISSVQQLKRQAMACYVSQLALQDYAGQIAGLNTFRAIGLGRAVTSAEAFVVVAAEELDGKLSLLLGGIPAWRRQLGCAAFAEDLPLVSIIVRSMDRPSLGKALDSLALQTYPHCEVLVVNAKGDGHTPPGDQCGRFPLRFCQAGRPLARSEAANFGLENARGDYLLFHDDDDWCEPHHIASLVTTLERCQFAAAAYCEVRSVDPDGNLVRRFAEEFDRIRLCTENYLPIHAVLFRSSVVAAGLRFDNSLEVCEDWDFWLQVAERGDFVFNAQFGATYRIDERYGSNVWSDPARTREVMTAIYRKWLPKWPAEILWGVMDYARSRPVMMQAEQQLRSAGYSVANLSELVDAVVRARQDLASARQEATQARQDREAIYASFSWQCTKPLRALGRLARRLG